MDPTIEAWQLLRLSESTFHARHPIKRETGDDLNWIWYSIKNARTGLAPNHSISIQIETVALSVVRSVVIVMLSGTVQASLIEITSGILPGTDESESIACSIQATAATPGCLFEQTQCNAQ